MKVLNRVVSIEGEHQGADTHINGPYKSRMGQKYAEYQQLIREVRCLVCQNQSIDDSDAELARDLRVLVRERLIAGDTNDWRNTLAEGPLAENGFKHATAPISRYRTFPSYLSVGSLDKAFHCGAIRIAHVRVVRSNLAKTASDHLPLVVDLHLNH